MARAFNSSDYSYAGTAGLLDGATSLSFSTWVSVTAFSGVTNCIAGNWGSSGHLFARITTASTFRVSINQPAETAWNNTDFTWNTGQWYHVAVTWDGSTLRLYQNGTVGGTTQAFSTTLGTSTGVWTVGNRAPASSGTDLKGSAAETALWRNVTLSADQVKSLSRGFTPPLVRRAGLVLYAPLFGDSREHTAQIAATLTGTPTVADHPTSTILPMSPIYHPKGAGGGGGGGAVIPKFVHHYRMQGVA
jgi:hypothetical protein